MFTKRVLTIFLAAHIVISFTDQLTFADQLRKERTEGKRVYYAGAIVVSGRFSQELENEFNPGLCFYPQGKSAKLIPRQRGDERIPWFCFSNQPRAFLLLKVPKKLKRGVCEIEGNATIVVSNYVVDTTPSEVSDLAQIDRVVTVSGLTHKPCSQ